MRRSSIYFGFLLMLISPNSWSGDSVKNGGFFHQAFQLIDRNPPLSGISYFKLKPYSGEIVHEKMIRKIAQSIGMTIADCEGRRYFSGKYRIGERIYSKARVVKIKLFDGSKNFYNAESALNFPSKNTLYFNVSSVPSGVDYGRFSLGLQPEGDWSHISLAIEILVLHEFLHLIGIDDANLLVAEKVVGNLMQCQRKSASNIRWL